MTMEGTIEKALQNGKIILKNAGIESYAIDAELLLMHVLEKDRIYILTNPQAQLPNEVLSIYNKTIEKRATDTPIAYLTGHCEFYSLPFIVNENVLIPRPDTEILVDTVINEIKKTEIVNEKEIKMLEIGIGSGCISVATAKNCEKLPVFVQAVDISEKALETARKNAEMNGVSHKIKFILSDLFENVADADFNIICSNPPYIPSGEISSLDRCVGHYEPIDRKSVV